ncbi:hypothetical protein [Delftia sp. GW456-R20]|uniref:hypothetical protein n=1 Tax=Delftia sp. GW456-R20 TaxID=1827145 RepID=UPI000A990F86|nr:hypothetical protein [Delftia sp. GW456-R20]
MIFNIDFGIFLASGESFGQISGKIESHASPVPGMSFTFIFPLRKTEISPFSHWDGYLCIGQVAIIPLPSDAGDLSISLSDLVMPSRSDAEQVVSYFQEGFGLYFDPTD